MSIATTVHEPAPPAVDGQLPDVVELLGSVVSSAEPAVVFSSVAQVCVPRICSSVVVAIADADERGYVIENPPEPRTRHRADRLDDNDVVVVFGGIRIARTSVMTEISGPATARHCAYEGVLAMTFTEPGPTHRLLGQFVVGRAVAMITRERLHDLVETHNAHAESLTTALRSSRDIGIALGIIMSRHHLTEADAFNSLRTRSQDTQRKVRDIALDIAQTGQFDLPGRVVARRAVDRPDAASNIVSLIRPTPC